MQEACILALHTFMRVIVLCISWCMCVLVAGARAGVQEMHAISIVIVPWLYKSVTQLTSVIRPVRCPWAGVGRYTH